MSPDPATDPASGSPAAPAAVVAYHERTKHHYARYAASLGYLDWESQPDPFRRYVGAARVRLPRAGSGAAGSGAGASGSGPTYEQLFHPGEIAPRPLELASVSDFFFHSMALSAWKRLETARWSLRVNPSSGNLHPTEAYAWLPPLEGLCDATALHHYAPDEHALERRAELEAPSTSSVSSTPWAGLPEGAFLLGLSSVPWRESWKYGERAWRYCEHDVGHALGALRLAAALCGWTLAALPDVDDGSLATLLGLDRDGEFVEHEPEHGALLAVVHTRAGESPTPCDWAPPAEAVAAARDARWSGRAAPLSADHHPWPVIGEIERACRKTAGEWALARPVPPPAAPLPIDRSPDVPDAARVIRGRRSAVAMDGRTGLTAGGFFDMLARTLPSRAAVPWDAVTWPGGVDLALFVHRVGDVEPGLYLLVRDPERRPRLRAACKPGFEWTRPEGCPESLPLFRLEAGDVRRLAASVSCGQDIAADGAFSCGMLAEFEGPLARHGAPLYRHLFWETGVIGQVLYLEAEAAGIRSTGIGCFFDDPVHQALGLRDRSFQSLYHFTVGGAVDDPRLQTDPAYPD